MEIWELKQPTRIVSLNSTLICCRERERERGGRIYSMIYSTIQFILSAETKEGMLQYYTSIPKQ